MTNITKLFSYQGNEVTFRNTKGVAYVNATQMAKSFGNEKRPQFWLNNQNTNEFLSEISKARNIALAELVIVTKGGSNSGTWMYEDVALEFSRWLSPAFSIWCNDRIKELLTVGMTATPETLENILSNPDLIIGLANQVKELRSIKEEQDCIITAQEKKLESKSAKEDYADRMLGQNDTVAITVIAKRHNMTAKDLNSRLKNEGVQRYVSGCWVLNKAYQDKGYGRIVSKQCHDGVFRDQLEWTKKGEAFISHLIAPLNRELYKTKNIPISDGVKLVH